MEAATLAKITEFVAPLPEPDDSEPARPAKVEEYLKSIPDRPHFPHLSSDHSNRMREGIALENSGRSDDFEKSLAMMNKFEKDFTLACRGHLDEEETDKLWDSLFNMACREFFTICPELDRYDWLKENPEHETKPAKRKTGKSVAGKPKYWKAARRVSRSEETWRILDNYPNYEISSHGRVRSLSRVRPDDWLKPRRRWQYGHCVESIVLFDKDHIRRERDIGWLLVASGFLKRPKWAVKKSSSVE